MRYFLVLLISFLVIINVLLALSPKSIYLQEELPKIVLSKDEMFYLDLNDFFQINNPSLELPNLSLKSTIEWKIQPQYSRLDRFPVNFTLIKALPVLSSPYIIFLANEGVYLYEFINSKSTPNLLQSYLFNNFLELKEKEITCFDIILLDSWNIVIDCNAKGFFGEESVFLLIGLEESDFKIKFMETNQAIFYHIEIYLDYMLHCPRVLYAHKNQILQFCKYLSLVKTKEPSCFSEKSCSNQIILWQINEKKINFLLELDEFTLNVPKICLPLKIQEILINWKTDTLMILDLNQGVYQYNFTNLQLKKQKTIEFHEENDTFYYSMEINKVKKRIPSAESKLILMVCSNKHCVEVFLKDAYEFYFSKRYDYRYFMENYLENSNLELFFNDYSGKTHKLTNIFLIELNKIQINNNFINMELHVNNSNNEIDHYQIIFSRKQSRIAIHYMRHLPNETIFLKLNFLYDEGDYYLEIVKNETFWTLTEITDLYLVLFCCPISLINDIKNLYLPFKISNGEKIGRFFMSNLSLTLIPLNYPHVLPASKILKFQFEDPLIYIKLSNIAIGPEIEFIYLSGNNANFKLTIDHIHQIKLDISDDLLEKLLKYEFVGSWIENESLSLRIVFKYNETNDLGTIYRFMGLQCYEVSNIYIGNCKELSYYEKILINNQIDFYLETTNSNIYIHEKGADHIKLYKDIGLFILLLTPTKVYSTVIFSQENLIFAIPERKNSIEVYYIFFGQLQKAQQTEKILNIEAHNLGLSSDLYIIQIDLTLIFEGTIIVVSKDSEYSASLIVLQIVQSPSIKQKFNVRLSSIRKIDPCQVIVMRVRKIILVCADMITEMKLSNPFSVERIRNYPLYRYNLIKDMPAFTDNNMIYVYASYYSPITQNIQPVILIYDPSKTAASLLVTSIDLASVLSITSVLQVQTELSLLLMTSNGEQVLSKNKVKEKEEGIFLNLVALQPALTGIFKFKQDSRTINKKQNEKTFEINVSFTNENSNMNLVSTLHININLKDYNIFLSNSSLNNEKIFIKLSKEKRNHIFVNTNFFRGPIEEYVITRHKMADFILNFKDFLTEGPVLADYQESLYKYGLVLDMISTNEFIIVLSQYKLIIYKTNDFPFMFIEENLEYQNDKCSLAHHKNELIIILSCFTSFELIIYRYSREGALSKTFCKIPNYVGLISKIVPINDYLFIQTHLFNSLNETEFCICEFPFAVTSLKVLGLITSEDFDLMNIKSQDFELIEIAKNATFMKFGVFIVQTFQMIYLEIEIIENRYVNKPMFSLTSNPFDAHFTSFNIDQILVLPRENNSYFKLIGLIGTDEHLYELELEFDTKQNKIHFSEPIFVYRKYCKCQNLPAKAMKFKDYVARVCSYNLKDKDMTINLFREDRKDLYHFIQIYKKTPFEQEAHPIRVIKVLFSPELGKLFLFYTNFRQEKESLHLLTASYLNYLIDYEINEWMSLNLYFLAEKSEIDSPEFDFKIIAKNDFSSQDINITLFIEREIVNSNVGISWIIIIGSLFLLFFMIGLGLFLFKKWRKRKKISNESPKNAKKSINNNIELRFVD